MTAAITDSPDRRGEPRSMCEIGSGGSPAAAACGRTGEDEPARLTDRELEVLKLVAQGLSYEDIGSRLFISPNTVKFHLRTIYLRLGVRNRVAAARLLTDRGDLSPQLSSGGDI